VLIFETLAEAVSGVLNVMVCLLVCPGAKGASVLLQQDVLQCWLGCLLLLARSSSEL